MEKGANCWYRVEFEMKFKAKNEWDENQGFKTISSATEFNYQDSNRKTEFDKRFLKYCWEWVQKSLDHYIDNYHKLVSVEITQVYRLIYNSKHNVNGFRIDCE